jgi:hypothetical protein
MEWNPAEVPEEILRDRVAQVAAACGAHGCDAVLYYTSYTRPAQVSALTHFVPFWSQALLAITPSGASMLTMATTGRTVPWIHAVSRVDEVIVSAEIGASAGRWLRERTPARRIAIAALDDLPHSAHAGLRGALPEAILEAAGPWHIALEAGFDPAPRVAQRARAMAASALALVQPGVWPNAQTLVAALDGHCRGLGAEDVLVKVAPDLAHNADPCRLEGPVNLGAHFGVRLTLAYKGYWLRTGSSFSHASATTAEVPACTEALRALRETATRTRSVEALIHSVQAASGARVDAWNLEARRGGLPLASIGASEHRCGDEAPAFSTFSAQLEARQEHGGAPLILSTPL